jgi:hypothetical protein
VVGNEAGHDMEPAMKPTLTPAQQTAYTCRRAAARLEILKAKLAAKGGAK